MGAPVGPSVSILVPAYNEEGNVPEVTARLDALLARERLDGEIVLIDDGSTDGTWAAIQAAALRYPRVRGVHLPRNRGKTSALLQGFEGARGEVFVIFDADLQFDPEDIPRMIAMIRDGADLVAGWKQGRYEKRTVSAIFNYLSRKLFDLQVHDLNAMKAFRREVIEGMILRGEWHRYIVPLAADRGYVIREVPVRLRPRLHGESKYGFWRIPVGLLDLVSVKFHTTFMERPMLLFGSLGLGLFLAGFLVGCVALYMRFILLQGFRPLLYLVLLLVLAGIVFFALGFLSEGIADVRGRLELIERRLPGGPGRGAGEGASGDAGRLGGTTSPGASSGAAREG